MLLLFLSPANQEIYLKKENIMVEVTEAATKQIAEYFKGKEVAPIRIFLNSGG
jgi:hypothetical protein